jgi:surface polysaccharide O-acyltransferase-like enzyme
MAVKSTALYAIVGEAMCRMEQQWSQVSHAALLIISGVKLRLTRVKCIDLTTRFWPEQERMKP